MIYIRFQFPAGRYHATPWGSHVNEGDVEWPPSPWRLLRALLSVGFTHLHWQKIPDDAETLIQKLAGCHPAYALPVGVPIHTRHYMPVHEGSKVKSAKIFDTAIRIVDGESLWMRFDAALTANERKLLGTLTEHLAFLGRAESWVDVDLVESCDENLNWFEPNQATAPELNSRLVRVLSTQPSDEYLRWRSGAIVRISKARAASAGKDKLASAQQKKLEQDFPKSLSECLMTTTSFLQATGWSQPPGSLWIDYTIPQGSSVIHATQRRNRRHAVLPEAAILALTSDSVRGTTLPSDSVGLFVAENMHKACVAKIARLTSDEGELATFTGRDRFGKMMPGHRHAHFIPLCLKGDKRHIDHILMIARDGIGSMAQKAIAGVDAIYAAGLPKAWVTVLGFASLQQVQNELQSITRGPRFNIFGAGQRFRSLTPFVASRHLKLKNGKYTLADNLADECRFRNLPPARIVSPDLNQCRNCGRFRIARIGTGRQPPQAEGWFLEIEFDNELADSQLPLALGYGSHFGLGLFAAE